MYEVIRYFEDLQDNNHPYNVGDIFPHDGMTAKEERLRELSGSNNKQRKPLIRKISEEAEEKTSPYTKTEIQRMSVDSLRILAKEVGIENPDEISGSELKKMLIHHFNL